MLGIHRTAAVAEAVEAALEAAQEAEGDPSLQSIERRRAELERSDGSLVIHGSEFPGSPAQEVKPVAETCKRSSVSRFWGTLLYRLVRNLKPTRCLELGTCLGISTAYLGAGLEANGLGSLVSGEGSAAMLALAFETLRSANVGRRVELVHGPFQETLPKMIARLQSVEFAYIDGHHDRDATVAYFDLLQPSLAPNAVVVLDDIRWSDEMHEAWQTTVARRNDRVAIDLGRMGVLVTGCRLND